MALASLAPGYFIEPNSHSSVFNSSKPCSSPYYWDYKFSCRKCRIGATATATPPGSRNEQKVSSVAAVARKKWQRRFSCNSLFDSLNLTCRSEGDSSDKRVELINRRQVLSSLVGSVAVCLPNAVSFLVAPPADAAASSRSEFADMPALRGKDYGKTRMRYPDYTETETGLQFKDLRTGTGPTPKIGDTVVVDWDGYTIGYYGRIFEARNKTKGGSFEGDDKDFFKFKIGFQEVIPAFEEAVSGMTLGGIRRIIVPPELGYPDNDYNKKGPRPTTFSGQRALDFVLRNQGLIDKTLLFDIELMKIIPN